jgi:hypothetical protein
LSLSDAQTSIVVISFCFSFFLLVYNARRRNGVFVHLCFCVTTTCSSFLASSNAASNHRIGRLDDERKRLEVDDTEKKKANNKCH